MRGASRAGLLFPEEVGKRLGISPGAVERLRRGGVLPAIDFGYRDFMFEPGDVNFLAAELKSQAKRQ